MEQGVNNALIFLIGTVIDLYVIVLIMRFIFPLLKISGYNQIAQLILKLTNPLITPLQQILPRYRHLDVAVISCILVFSGLKLALLSLLAFGAVPNILVLSLLTLRAVIDTTLTLFIYALIIRAILSWVNPMLHNPATEVLGGLTEPLMRPVRQVLPPFSGIDLSPLVVILILSTLKILI